MVVESGNWKAEFKGGITALDCAATSLNEATLTARPRPYTLATAISVVRRMETSAARTAVFAEIIAKNPVFRLVDRAYSLSGSRIFQPLALFLYMLKTVLMMGPAPKSGSDAIAVSNFGNEKHSIERLVAIVPEARIMQLSMKRSHLFGLGQMGRVARMIAAAPRLWPFLSRLARNYSFMPAARMASALASYMRFHEDFARNPELRAGIIASNYSPDALGLAAAAHRHGANVIYTNHAPVPPNGAFVPPVLADCAVFYGETVGETYSRHSVCTAEIALIGQDGQTFPMRWHPDRPRQVGIFLTALTCADEVENLVASIHADLPQTRILIRNHPVALLKSDFGKLKERYTDLEVTIGTPLDDEIAACDIVFCGNSGVALNALRSGCPVAYHDALDDIVFDYNGFVASGLVCPVEGWSPRLYEKLAEFYGRSDWTKVMRGYDASYDSDEDELHHTASSVIRRYLRPTSGKS